MSQPACCGVTRILLSVSPPRASFATDRHNTTTLKTCSAQPQPILPPSAAHGVLRVSARQGPAPEASRQGKLPTRPLPRVLGAQVGVHGLPEAAQHAGAPPGSLQLRASAHTCDPRRAPQIDACRDLSASYLQCRMDRKLMAPEELERRARRAAQSAPPRAVQHAAPAPAGWGSPRRRRRWRWARGTSPCRSRRRRERASWRVCPRQISNVPVMSTVYVKTR